MRKVILLLTALAGPTASADEGHGTWTAPCFAAEMAEGKISDAGFTLHGIGERPDGAMVEVYTDSHGGFIVVARPVPSIACMLASGDTWAETSRKRTRMPQR